MKAELAATETRATEGATILVVEDSRIQAEMLRRTLTGAGYVVVLAGHGAEGLVMARSHRPTVVVSDVTMPVMDGFTFCHQLRQDPAIQDIPVILLTALSDSDDVILGLKAGADCYVTKPYDAPLLLSRVAAMVTDPPLRGQPQETLAVKVAGKTVQVRAGAQQILNLLVSTYENSMLHQRDLAASRDTISSLNVDLEDRVRRRTLELEQTVGQLGDEIETRRSIAEQLGASFRALERLNERLGTLDKLGKQLQVCRSPEDAFEIIRNAATQMLPSFPGMLAVVDPSSESARVVVEWGKHTGGEPIWSKRDCLALRPGVMHAPDKVNPRVACSGACGLCGAPGLCMPLIVNETTLGLLRFEGLSLAPSSTTDRENLEHEAQIHFVEAAATTIALGLANINLLGELRQQSWRDALTGLYNRRFLDDALRREAARAVRSGNPLSLIMLDIDLFKRVNDNHGHLAGDQLLRWLGNYLQQSVRGEDLACRYGGEEFLLLLPGANLENAGMRAEQIRIGVEAESRIELDGAAIGPITVSLGVTTTYLDANDEAHLVAAVRTADEALLRAKRQGRNCVAHAGLELGRSAAITNTEAQGNASQRTSEP